MFQLYIFFPTKVNLENDGDLYSFESNAALSAGIDLLMLRINQLWRSQYRALLPIIVPNIITKTTLVGLEHAL